MAGYRFGKTNILRLDWKKSRDGFFKEEGEVVPCRGVIRNEGLPSQSWLSNHCWFQLIRFTSDRPIQKMMQPLLGERGKHFAVLFAVTYQLLFDTGGVVNVAGCHRVRPRLIFFTDGRPTDEAMEFGTDTQSNVNEVYLHQVVYVLQTVVWCVCFSPLFPPLSCYVVDTHTERMCSLISCKACG